MIYDRATRLLATERAVALLLAVAVLRLPRARFLAAELLADLVFATEADDVYRSTYNAVIFATGVIRS